MNFGLLTLAMTVAQPVQPAVPPMALPAAQHLFVKASVSVGGKVTWYPGTDAATQTNTAVGLRPGYPYRLQLSDIPGKRNVTLFPSLEVRGSLVPRPGLDVTQHPVPIVVTERDIDAVLDGRLVTKVYFLENPEKAIPVDGVPGESLEVSAISEEDSIKEARYRGRPMLIFRLGERPFTKDELARESIPGTILFAGTKNVPVPSVAPMLPFAGIIVYDPIIGAKGAGEECLADGGDINDRLGIGVDGKMRGLDPSDTAMQFTSPRAGTRIAPSNRVCICVPRFGAARVETGVGGHHVVHVPITNIQNKPASALIAKAGPGIQAGIDQPSGYVGQMRPTGLIGNMNIEVASNLSKLGGISQVKGVAVTAEIRGPDEITTFPGCGSLVLQKRVDPPNPDKIGQEVTFFLSFRNPTTEEMTGIVIADSLTTRLEYIEGTAKCSRGATFSATPNTAGSLVLKWAIDGKLQPGETGTISFKAKIR